MGAVWVRFRLASHERLKRFGLAGLGISSEAEAVSHVQLLAGDEPARMVGKRTRMLSCALAFRAFRLTTRQCFSWFMQYQQQQPTSGASVNARAVVSPQQLQEMMEQTAGRAADEFSRRSWANNSATGPDSIALDLTEGREREWLFVRGDVDRPVVCMQRCSFCVCTRWNEMGGAIRFTRLLARRKRRHCAR